MNFEELKLNKQLLNAVADLGFTQPTEIQEKAIPQIQAGHDILGVAQTGTGKTAAYLLPLLMKVKYAQGKNPRAMIIAPTRELVIQIADHAKELAKYTDIRILALYGGIGPKTQIESVMQGVDLIIATPGRFMDIYRTGELIPKEIKSLIIDEADKMMDMGFMPQIRQILEVIPRKRQNLLFSATMPDKVIRLTEEFLEFPLRIEVAPQATVAQTIDHYLIKVPNFLTKINLLGHLLTDKEKFRKVIIFVKTKEVAENIYKFIERKIDSNVRVLHGNKAQSTRINSIDSFKNADVRILVATDVAARGIDVTMVSHVINFEVPVVYEDYVHRIGRTGRAGQEGEAITFVNDADLLHIPRIEALINKKIPELPFPSEVKVEPTTYEEKQDVARMVDKIKRKADPEFKGAFHEKKRKPENKDKKAGKWKKKR